MEAFQRNWIGLLEAMPNASSWRENGMVMCITGLPIAPYNAVIVEDERALAPEALPRITQPFDRAGLSYSIQVCSRTPTPRCAAWLPGYGYTEIFCDPLMIFEGPLTVLPNPSIAIRPVSTPQDRNLYFHLIVATFNLPGDVEEFVDLMLDLKGSHSVLAWAGAEAVGTGTVIGINGAAGIYNVATALTARRKGVATTIMGALHSHALAHGYTATALAASQMGLPLYQRLGYRLDGYQTGYMRSE